MNTIHESLETPVLGEYDVIVCGGGISGLTAAVSAARLGASVLLLEKGVCDLYVHGVIESSTSNVHQTFSYALSDSLAMQDTLYDKMAAKGWYPTDRAEMTKVQAVKKKFQSMQG